MSLDVGIHDSPLGSRAPGGILEPSQAETIAQSASTVAKTVSAVVISITADERAKAGKIFDDTALQSLKVSAQGGRSAKMDSLTSKQIKEAEEADLKAIKNSHAASIQELNTSCAKAASRLKRIALFSQIVDGVFLVICVAAALSPLVFPGIPQWISIVTLLGGGCLISCLVSPLQAKAAIKKKEIENRIKFHETFLWSMEKESSLRMISEADVLCIDPRLASDKRKSDLNKTGSLLSNQKFDSETINAQEQLFSTKSYKDVAGRYGLIDVFGPRSGGKLAVAARISKAKNEASRDLERNFHTLKSDLAWARRGLAEMDPVKDFQENINEYLKALEIILKKQWGPSRDVLIAKTSNNPKIQEQLKNKEEQLAFFCKGSAFDSAVRYQKLFKECEGLHKEIITAFDELQIGKDGRSVIEAWDRFIKEKSSCVLGDNPTPLLKWGYALCWEAKLERMHKALKGWSNEVSLKLIRENIAQATSEIRVRFPISISTSAPYLKILENLEQKKAALEREYHQLCQKKMSDGEKMVLFTEFKAKFTYLQSEFDGVGSEQTLGQIQKTSFKKFLFTKTPPDAYPKPQKGQADKKLLQKALKHTDRTIDMQTAQVKIALMVTIIAMVAIEFICLDNIYVNVSFVLALIQMGALYSWFNKNHIMKWEKEKRVLKMAYYLLEYPQLMNVRHLPPMPKEVIKASKELTLPLQKALLLSRTIVNS